MKKRILPIALCCIAIVLAVVLVIVGVSKMPGKEKPGDTALEFIEALRNGDFTKASEYSAEGTMGTLEIDEDTQSVEIVKLYFKNLQAKARKTEVNGKEAIVTMDIDNKDLAAILDLYLNKALEIAMRGLTTEQDSQADQDELMNYFKSLFDSNEVECVTTSIEVKLVKVDGNWRVVVDEKLRDAILPGLAEAAEQVNTTTESEE